MDESGRGPSRCIISGWACWRIDLADGRRQIFGFLLPGDRIGDKVLGSGAVVAITPVRTVDTAELCATARRLNPFATLPVQPSFAIDQAALLDQIVRLGQFTAYERVAHMFMDISRRLKAVGLTDDRVLPFPLTQECLANALGLSPVHLNRTLQRLRKEKLIALRSSVLSILRPDALAAISECLESPRQDDLSSRPRLNDGMGRPARLFVDADRAAFHGP